MTVITTSIAPILVLTGATASGKSALALSIAETLDKQNRKSVIVNADSQQIYKELRIITARPGEEDEKRVPHRLYGMLSASEHCSAGIWLNYARMEIDWALRQGMQAIVVGGTGLYLKALLEGIADIPAIPPSVRAQAVSDYEQMGKDAFAERLKWVDPAFFERLNVYDKQRLIRAYEVWLGSGKPLSWWQNRKAKPLYPRDHITLWQVELPREELYRRCNRRVGAMLEAGAVEEVRQLLELNLPAEVPAMKSVGVRELGAYLRGDISLDQAIADMQQATRNYAKRQLTWMRHQLTPDRMLSGEIA